MRTRLQIAWLLALTVIAGEGAPSVARAHQPDVAPAGLPSNPMDAVGNIADSMAVINGGQGVRVKLLPAIRAAAAVARDADETGRAEAEGRLTKLLQKYFDDDMARRKQEAALLEQRLSQLREQLDRRRTKKREIIELQAKVSLNDAEGLGFYLGDAKNVPGGPPTTDSTLISR